MKKALSSNIPRVLLVALLLAVSQYCFPQAVIKLSGTVIDKTTEKPIPYASLGVVGRNIGVVTNAEGNFIFNISSSGSMDTIVVSALGYYSYKSAISDLSNKEKLIIPLAQQVYDLSEVTVGIKKMTALEVMKKAIKKFKDNIDPNPYLMNAYYRTFLKEDSMFVIAAEAAVTIFQHYSNKPNFDRRTKLNEIRSSEDYRQKEYFLDNKIDVTVGMALSLKSFLPEGNLKKHEFIIDSFCMYNNRLVYVISLHEMEEYKYIYLYEMVEDRLTNKTEEIKVDSVPNKSIDNITAYYYIDALTFAFIKMDLLIQTAYREFSSNPLFENYCEVDGKEYLLDFNMIHNVIDYKQIGDFWYPTYFSNNVIEWYHDKDTKEPVLKTPIYSEFFVNDIITDSVKEIPFEELYHQGYSILTLDVPEDKEFWQNYNYIPDDSLRKAAFRDIEKLKK